MIILLFLAFCFLLYMSVTLRVLLAHPLAVIVYGVRDLYHYIKYRRWNECRTGRIICYMGLFGKGKTLSAVHYVQQLYNRYNDKIVYDTNRKKYVTQKVHVISNVELSDIPYERFVSLSQLVACADTARVYDFENDTRTVHIALGDEFSVQMNSREFKNNIDPLFLNTLLTCRHHNITLIYTSQRFNHVDALLRQVTSVVISCDKRWRVMVHNMFDAYELENVTNPLDVKPLSVSGWFVTDKDYAAYDTLACVENLTKSCKDGDMLTEEQILALQCNQPTADNVVNPSRHYMRRMKKLAKIKK